jgi:site-specific recombinase XerD
LTQLPSGTVAVYVSILRHFTQWGIERMKRKEEFQLNTLTSPMIEHYLSDLSAQGYSFSHRKRVKSVLLNFCQWLVDDQRMLSQNPVRGVKLAQPVSSKSASPHTIKDGVNLSRGRIDRPPRRL